LFERRILNLARLVVGCLGLVCLAIFYWQVIRGVELNPLAARPGGQINNPSQVNQAFGERIAEVLNLQKLPIPAPGPNAQALALQRTQNLMKNIQRGTIVDRNGRLLASDRQNAEGAWERVYAEPALAHVIGYTSGLRVGVAGLELAYNDTLLGLNRPDAQIERALHETVQGAGLKLTIDTPLQKAADAALAGKRGGIVVLDEHSGAVLAMASSPRFDPNRMNESGYVQSLLAACAGTAGCQSPLVNRAAQSGYTPGSVWKTVTLIAALDSGQVKPETVFDFGTPVKGPNGPIYIYRVGGGEVPDANHTENKLNLEMAYARSANYAFAQMGDQMPAATLLRYAKTLGFGGPSEVGFPLEIEYNPSQIARDPQALSRDSLLRAVTAIGQGEVLTNPLNMSMVVLAVANQGRIPVPYFVQSIQEPGGGDSEPTNRRAIENVMQPQTAQLVRQYMITTVQKGSGYRANLPGLVVGGKTGTAQLGGSAQPHAWFAGFAESGSQGVVIVVMIENGGEGSQAAAPIFASLAKMALTGKP
jgi:peptidoglycan glycosyltransferase